MSELCSSLGAEMGELFTCAQHGAYVRIRTPYLYPDGDVIDLFAQKNAGEMISVTDLGETVRWLRMQTVSSRRSPKQRQLITDVCLNHGVEFYKGQLLIRIKPSDSFAEAFTRLAQACLRVADIWFTFRTRAVESATDEVADFLTEKEIPFDRGERIPGRSGRVWRPDFHTRLPVRSTLVYVLSTGSRAAARGVAEHVLAAWYDLSHLRLGQSAIGFVSLFDDTIDVWTEEDFRLVDNLSEVARWSNHDQFLHLLEAA